MTLIKSISGIRGTIGGMQGEGLNPPDVIKFTAGYALWLKNKNHAKDNLTVVIGRDARISGKMVSSFVSNTLLSMGIHVIDLGLSTTPTVEMAVVSEKASGGIIITASHNPKEWNALKLLNEKGEFVSEKDGLTILKKSEKKNFQFADVNKLGTYREKNDAIQYHIRKILNMPLVDKKAIYSKQLKIVIDCVNSTGGIAVPILLKELGIKNIIQLYCEPNGEFPHNPEPLPEHLTTLSTAVKKHKAHLGIVVDPDVDRLAIVCEDGTMFGEEYTLVAVADYVLKNKKGNAVSNLSSTRALRDITEKAGGNYYASAVGEVNVVKKMKEKNAVIGGEGNGGVIVPNLHYGRDALAGIALFLSHFARSAMRCSALRATYPQYVISKNKIELSKGVNVDKILKRVQNIYSKEKINTEDGVKIDFEKEWIHLRKSNTEPIIRIYAESSTKARADKLAKQMVQTINNINAKKI